MEKKFCDPCLLESLARKFYSVNPLFKAVYLNENCPEIEKAHKKDNRVFAHTFCGYDDFAICVCKDFKNLPINIKCGILLHELGHIGVDALKISPEIYKNYDSETAADLFVLNHLGIVIEYGMFGDIKNIQYVKKVKTNF